MGSFQGKTYDTKEEAEEFIKEAISTHTVVIFSKVTCPYCIQAKRALNSNGIKYHVVSLTGRPDQGVIQDVLLNMTGARTVPRVFIHQKCIGGGNETSALNKQNKLKELVSEKPENGQLDLPA
uniref:Glutaredoxin-like n=1 Tax=Phallusia mammillata TaxID=59560 RepID=A0A6F9DEJ1_9ASCI|nr:glutaredoxin-like [Phallusia mammillata]